MTKQEREQIKKEELERWKNMIKWVEKQENNGRPDSDKMVREINMNWFSNYCLFCKNYSCDENEGISEIICPLAEKYGECEAFNEKNFWGDVRLSTTWIDWIYFARKFYKQMEKL